MKKSMHIVSLIAAVALVLLFLAAPSMAADETVSFNKATVEELMAIEYVHIPEELAQAIVDYREKNGPFKRAEDLLKVPGMTQDFLEELNPQEVEGDVIYDPDAPPALAPSKC
jgi:competence protein ComEA